MFSLKIATDNAAFEHPPTEVARILTELAEKLNSREILPYPGEGGKLRDFNGNVIGSWQFR
jgi:hypothetical protein